MLLKLISYLQDELVNKDAGLETNFTHIVGLLGANNITALAAKLAQLETSLTSEIEEIENKVRNYFQMSKAFL